MGHETLDMVEALRPALLEQGWIPPLKEPHKLRPLHDRITVRLPEERRELASGIVVPYARRDDVYVSLVEACGGDVEEVRPGMRVAHVRVVGVKERRRIGDEWVEFATLREHEILGIVEGDGEVTGFGTVEVRREA